MNTLEPSHQLPGPDTNRPSFTLVTSPACHLCEDAHAELLDRVALGQLSLDVVTAESDRGRALVEQHRPGLFPLVLLDGAFFSAGRLPRRKLDAVLARKVTA